MNTQNQNHARPSGQNAAGSAYKKATAALRATPAPKISLLPVPKGAEIEVGQVRNTLPVPENPPGLPEACRTNDPFLVVALETQQIVQREYQVLTVAPILVESEMAGPDDMLLPRSVLGFEAAVAVGSAVGMLAGNLADCQGTLPAEWREKLVGFRLYLQGVAEAPPPEIRTGPEYLDERDLRYQFHEELVDQLEYLQQPYAAFLQRETACQPCGQSAGGYDFCPICGRQTYEV